MEGTWATYLNIQSRWHRSHRSEKNHHYLYHFYIQQDCRSMLFYHGHGYPPEHQNHPSPPHHLSWYLDWLGSAGLFSHRAFWFQFFKIHICSLELRPSERSFLGWLDVHTGSLLWPVDAVSWAQVGLLTRHLHVASSCASTQCKNRLEKKHIPLAVPKTPGKPVKLFLQLSYRSPRHHLPYSSTSLNTTQIQSEEK